MDVCIKYCVVLYIRLGRKKVMVLYFILEKDKMTLKLKSLIIHWKNGAELRLHRQIFLFPVSVKYLCFLNIFFLMKSQYIYINISLYGYAYALHKAKDNMVTEGIRKQTTCRGSTVYDVCLSKMWWTDKWIVQHIPLT